MAKFIVLFDWTDQGVRGAHESAARVAQAKDAIKPMGVEIEQIFWTLGNHDLVGVLNAKDGESLAAALLKIAMSGNIRTTTLRAFSESEFGNIISKTR